MWQYGLQYSVLYSMEGESDDFQGRPRVRDEQVLGYLWAVVQRFRLKQEQNSIECILCEQKLVHLSVLVCGRQPEVKLQYSLKDEIVNLVQKINRLAMENIKDNAESGNSKFIAKAVDIIMLPEISKYLTESVTLTKLKILTFNNLACILKKVGRYMMGLKAVSFALGMEEELLKGSKEEEKYDIVPTYLNKAAILSDMGKHGKSLEEIRKARAHVERIEREVQLQMRECKSEELLRRLEEKRHYGLYMKMLIDYNIGVEKEHQRLLSSAVHHYVESKKLAGMIGNVFMAQKLEAIILKLRNER